MTSAVTPQPVRTERTTVATYSSYGDAQKAVEALVQRDFPVQKTAIVAQDIRFVEEVVGKRTAVSSAVEGALTGAGIGGLVGFLLGLFSFFHPVVSGFVLAFWGLLLGGAVGLALGVGGHSLALGRRDFASVGGFNAGRFDVVVDADFAQRASKHLRESGLLSKPTR